MPWCENCDKKNIKKEDVVFDERHLRVLCVPCAQEQGDVRKDADLQMEVFDKIWYGVSYTSDQGLKAEAVYGGTRLTINVSNDEFRKILGR